MKKIFIIFTILLLCGCSATYNLEISNDSFKENVSIFFDKESTEVSNYEDIESDDKITPYINNDYSALVNKKDNYKKKVIDGDNYTNVILDYKYNEKTFENSNLLNNCFENFSFVNKKTYLIKTSGMFYCLYEDQDEVTINIKTNNKVLQSNETSKTGNVYTWKINSSNVNNTDIVFEVEKGFPMKKFLIYFAIVSLSAFIIIVLLTLILNKRKRNNEI